MAKNEFSHIDKSGDPAMVDVGGKEITNREAIASATVHLGSDVMNILEKANFTTKKGPLFSTAIIAGTMAVKNTATVIPFCHPIPIDDCKIDVSKTSKDELSISCMVKTHAKTGVEMEAIHGASIAAITVYDMCKSLSHSISIGKIELREKSGGKSDFKR